MNTDNQNITFRGGKLTVIGNALKVGDRLPAFQVVNTDMHDVTNETFSGKVLVICPVPSLDTPVCAVETRRFNDEASKLSNEVEVLVVSLDLPFAQKRWCGAEGVERVRTASDYKYRSFGEAFGCYIKEMGLLARAVFVVDQTGTVQLVDYMTDISVEPDYDSILAKVKELSA